METLDITKLVRPNIVKMQAYSSARDEFKGAADVYVDANENPFGTYNRYPDPLQLKVKETLSAIKGVAVTSMFLGNGSDEVIDLAFRIFCEPGKDKALCFTPSYGMYKVSAEINNVALLELPLLASFQIDIARVKEVIKDEAIKLLFICNPNNPTANSFNKEDVLWLLQNFKGIIIVDEAYIDFSEQESYLTYINQFPNLIVSQTFSKAWGLAGIRVGIAYASEMLINLYNKVKPPYNISSVNQEVVLRQLENYAAIKDQIALLKSEKKRLISMLKEVLIVKQVYKSDTNFVLVKVTDATEVYNYLIAQNIIVRNRTKQVKNTIRITIGNPEENNKVIKALKQFTNKV